VPKLFVWDVLDLIASQEYGDETVNFIAGSLKKLKDRLDNYKDMKLELPKMNPARKLDDYQINGVKFLLSRGSALLAMSQGTGKTITGLVYIKKMYQMGKIQKAIVICPPMVRIEWLLEIHDWFGKGTLQRVGIVQGSPRDRQRIWNNKNTILYICNYELLSRRDAVWMKKLCQKYKVAIVCDESTKIKNTGKRRTSLMEIPARYRVAMSGTPFENHHIELYNLEQWLGTGLFGTKVDFISNYMSRRRRRQADNDSALHLMLVQKLMYRVLLQDVVDMKKLDIQERYVELPEEAKADYQKIVQIAEAKAGEWRATKEELDQLKLLITRDAETTKRIAVLEKKIKQIRGGMFAILNASRLYCAHPILLKLSNSGLANEVYDNLHAPKIAPKYDLLKKLMGEIAPDRSVIIFTGYVKMANKLYHKLKRMTDRRIFKLGGPTRMTVEDMLELKQNFAKHPGSVLISTDKGTYGLNLQSANVAIMYDQWWNPQRIGQRIARIYRRGQMKDCNSYLLMVKDEDVVEKAIHTVMGRKALFAGRVVDGWEPGSLGEALARR
jgi:SNF2 family DNA or RNA helicase